MSNLNKNTLRVGDRNKPTQIKIQCYSETKPLNIKSHVEKKCFSLTTNNGWLEPLFVAIFSRLDPINLVKKLFKCNKALIWWKAVGAQRLSTSKTTKERVVIPITDPSSAGGDGLLVLSRRAPTCNRPSFNCRRSLRVTLAPPAISIFQRINVTTSFIL